MSKMQLVKKPIPEPDLPDAIPAEDALPVYAPKSADEVDEHCWLNYEAANVADRLLIVEAEARITRREKAMAKYVNEWMPRFLNLFKKDGTLKDSTRHNGRYCGGYTYKPDRAPVYKITDKDAAVEGGLADRITKTTEVVALRDSAKQFGIAELSKHGVTVTHPDDVSFSPKKIDPTATR